MLVGAIPIYPSEKYESQSGWLFPKYGKIKHVQNHQPVCFQCFSLFYSYGDLTWFNHLSDQPKWGGFYHLQGPVTSPASIGWNRSPARHQPGDSLRPGERPPRKKMMLPWRKAPSCWEKWPQVYLYAVVNIWRANFSSAANHTLREK